MKTTLAAAIIALGAALALPAQAATIPVSYNFAGGLTAPPVFSAGFLLLNGAATGTLDPAHPTWNPATLVTSDALDLSTGLDNGTFSLTLANGETLSGLLFEDDTKVDLATDMGPFTQLLTFTGGTGEFLGVTGSLSGNGTITPDGYTVAGSGFLTAPGLVAVSEPGSMALMFGAGLAGAITMRRKVKLAV